MEEKHRLEKLNTPKCISLSTLTECALQNDLYFKHFHILTKFNHILNIREVLLRDVVSVVDFATSYILMTPRLLNYWARRIYLLDLIYFKYKDLYHWIMKHELTKIIESSKQVIATKLMSETLADIAYILKNQKNSNEYATIYGMLNESVSQVTEGFKQLNLKETQMDTVTNIEPSNLEALAARLGYMPRLTECRYVWLAQMLGPKIDVTEYQTQETFTELYNKTEKTRMQTIKQLRLYEDKVNFIWHRLGTVPLLSNKVRETDMEVQHIIYMSQNPNLIKQEYDGEWLRWLGGGFTGNKTTNVRVKLSCILEAGACILAARGNKMILTWGDKRDEIAFRKVSTGLWHYDSNGIDLNEMPTGPFENEVIG